MRAGCGKRPGVCGWASQAPTSYSCRRAVGIGADALLGRPALGVICDSHGSAGVHDEPERRCLDQGDGDLTPVKWKGAAVRNRPVCTLASLLSRVGRMQRVTSSAARALLSRVRSGPPVVLRQLSSGRCAGTWSAVVGELQHGRDGVQQLTSGELCSVQAERDGNKRRAGEAPKNRGPTRTGRFLGDTRRCVRGAHRRSRPSLLDRADVSGRERW